MDDNQHLNRLLESKTLGELFTRDSLQDYTRMQQTYVPPPEAPPLPVEHRPPPDITAVNFIIRGRADFGTDAYHGPSQDRVKADILNAILSPPEEGYKFWLPAVNYELTDVWDYTGGNDEQDTNEHRGAARTDPQVESAVADTLAHLIAGFRVLNSDIESLRREISDERAARALEAAVRPHGGPAGDGAPVHDRDGEAVPVVRKPGDRGTQRRGRDGAQGKQRPTPAADPRREPVDPDPGIQHGPTDPGEVRGDDAAGSTPVVAPGYIPVNPHTGEEL